MPIKDTITENSHSASTKIQGRPSSSTSTSSDSVLHARMSDGTSPLLRPRIEEVDNDGSDIVRSIPTVPVTKLYEPYINTSTSRSSLQHAGTARANIAPSHEAPQGTTHNNWAKNHSQQTVLQQHCAFFDRDNDGIIWPMDTFAGFHALGFGIFLSLVAVFVIHANFSYPTLDKWLPDPFFRVYIKNIHMDKHGSDTNTYDHEGRYIPQKFEDIFAKYADGRDYLTLWDTGKMLRGQRCIADPIGWGGAFFEWLATYLMLWPEDGRMKKEDIRRIYDGSIFHSIAAKRSKKKT